MVHLLFHNLNDYVDAYLALHIQCCLKCLGYCLGWKLSMMFKSIITVSLYPYAGAMAKCQPQSIEKEVIPFSTLPCHPPHSHYHHPQPLKNSFYISCCLPSMLTSTPSSKMSLSMLSSTSLWVPRHILWSMQINRPFLVLPIPISSGLSTPVSHKHCQHTSFNIYLFHIYKWIPGLVD